MKTQFDAIIIGAGLTGISTALACAQGGQLSIALIDARDPNAAPSDPRVSALSAAALRMYERLGVELGTHLQMIEDMLVSEGGPASPWQLHFNADAPTGGIVENDHLRAALLGRIAQNEAITLIAPKSYASTERSPREVSVTLGDGTELYASLLIAADGRNSRLRTQAGITTRTEAYDQKALVTIITHELPHDGLALQRFLPGGPLGVLPLPGQRSQIVWSDRAEAIDAALALPDKDFCNILQERMGDYLGEIQLNGPRSAWPLALQMASAMTAERLALVGDAAHVIHPLAGQGLNLGLRDAAALADGLVRAKRAGQDIGVAGFLEYPAWRQGDMRSMAMMTDGLNRLFRARGPIGHLRRIGLSAVNTQPLLKHFFAQEAAGEIGTLPRLMRA